ncbi:MAG TPA: ABC transporter permease, partial [Ruminococcaceae bacterium]|nr:ABC transporter permease [Oscillospiraceae bacterium]HCM22842.1 ABC transporter permease [Oscillospiraceae bacterium]
MEQQGFGRRRGERAKNFTIFALPGFAIFLCVVIVPFFYGLYLTFTDWDGVTAQKNMVGFANYAALFQDQQFWTSMWLTIKYVLFSVILVNIIAFLFAYVLTSGVKGQNFFRAG